MKFNWIPDKGVEVQRDFESALREVKFGDGVVQLQKRNLAKPKRTFSLKFTNTTAKIDEIEDFLMENLAKKFKWDYLGKEITVYCADVSRSVTGIVDVLSCKFQEY